jgi:hypothetical protein
MIDGRPKKEEGRPKTAGEDDDERQRSSFVRKFDDVGESCGRREEGGGRRIG